MVGSAGRVYSIEAHPATFLCLEATVRLNRLSNVVFDQLAIADQAGEVAMEDQSNAHISNAMVPGSSGSLKVEAMTLDTYVERAGIDRIDLLKMNIEGAEVAALQGGASALERTRNVVVSCHDFKADRTGNGFFRTKETVRHRLTEAGFELLERADDPRPWVRDTVYGYRAATLE